MAENKNTIVVYSDWINIFDKLSDAEAGRLIKHFFRYVNDLNPKAPDRITELLFEPIKSTLKRDLRKYEEIRKKRSEAGKSGGRPTIDGKQTEAKKANALFDKQTEAKKADSVSVSVSDNVNEEINIEFKKKLFLSAENPIEETFKAIEDLEQQWLETISMNFKTGGINFTIEKLKKFYDKLENEGVEKISIKEAKRYFSNCLSKGIIK